MGSWVFAQVDVSLESPQYSLAGLSPLITLAVGSLLLIMFRSVVKHLPVAIESRAVVALGPITVAVAWIVAGLVGDGFPFSDFRSNAGGLLSVLLAIVVLLLSALLVRVLRAGFDAVFCVGVALVAFASIVSLWNDHWRSIGSAGSITGIGDQFSFDGFGLVLAGVIVLVVALCALLLDDYLLRENIDGPEMYVLMLLSAAGGVVMTGAGGLIVLFLGLETLSIAVYVMAALHLRRNESLEAGLKYFILGAFSSAFLLYGIALIYGSTGSMNFSEIGSYFAAFVIRDDAMLLAGLALLLVGFGFKVAAVPFHGWTPDVYQGAPTPVVAFMASAVKVAGFAALLRVFVVNFAFYRIDWQPAIFVLAVLSLLVGAFVGIVQHDVKRMLAYSSISHAGFILVGVQAATARGTAAVVFYLVAYAFMALGSFAVITVVSGRGDRKTSLDDLNGLASRHPLLAMVLTVFLLAQAGVPLTVGFVAKFEIIGAAVDARSFWLAVVAMLAAVVSAFLYLRVVLSMYLGKSSEPETVEPTHPAAVVAIGLAFAVTIIFGLFPSPLTDLTREAIPTILSLG